MLLFVALSLLIGMFIFTDPNKISLAFLLVPFILIGYASYLFIFLLIDLHSKSRTSKGVITRLVPLSFAFLIVSLLLLSSLGQLTVKDSLLVVGFTVLFLLYIGRADFLK